MTQGVDKDELAECRFSVDLLPSGMQGWTTIDSPIHDGLGVMPSFSIEKHSIDMDGYLCVGGAGKRKTNYKRHWLYYELRIGSYLSAIYR